MGHYIQFYCDSAIICTLLCGNIFFKNKKNTQFNWSTLTVISQLEHIKFIVINSLL